MPGQVPGGVTGEDPAPAVEGADDSLRPIVADGADASVEPTVTDGPDPSDGSDGPTAIR